MSQTTLKDALNKDLSELLRHYEEQGLDPEQIEDAFEWHAELASTRAHEPQTLRIADD